jgi:hypothetical protein
MAGYSDQGQGQDESGAAAGLPHHEAEAEGHLFKLIN